MQVHLAGSRGLGSESCCLGLLQGSVLASDAFFPFSWNDSVELACKAGVAAIVHPGGSLRDQVCSCLL